MKRLLFGLATTGLAVAAIITAGTGAVTNAGGMYVYHQRNVQDLGSGIKGISEDSSNKTAVVNLKNIDLAATGINTKTLSYIDQACGNTSMAYDDSPPGSAYKVTNHTSWNAQGNSVPEQCDLDVNSDGSPRSVTMWGPNGCSKYFQAGVDPGQTITDSQDCTGSASTKTQWTLMIDINGNFRYACGYTIPGGGGYWTLSICSV
jgi:hypothetical protein